MTSVENITNDLEGEKKYLTNIFRICKEEMEYLLRFGSSNFNTIFGGEVFNEYMPDTESGIYSVRFQNDRDNIINNLFSNIMSINYNKLSDREIKQVIYNYCLWDILIQDVVDQNQREEFQRIVISNISILFQRGLTSSVMLELADRRENQYQVKPLPEKNKSEEKALQILYQVDKQELWKEKYIRDKVGRNLQERVENYLEKVSNQPIFYDVTDLCKNENSNDNVRTKFMMCNDGESYTYIKRAKKQFEKIWCNEDNFIKYKERTYICLMEHFILIEILDVFLYKHSGAWYGREEARALRQTLYDMPVVLWKEQELCNKILELYDEKISKFISTYSSEKGKRSGILNDVEVESTLRNAYKNENGYDQVWNMLKNKYGASRKNEEMFEYIVWKLWGYYGQDDNKNENEPIVLWDDQAKYIFHSYLRYQQETDPEYEELGKVAGLLSERESQFATAEESAINQEKNHVVLKLQEHINISENDFEKIFG